MIQFVVIRSQHRRRSDRVVFVSGLPLGVIKLKAPGSEQATWLTAFYQLQLCCLRGDEAANPSRSPPPALRDRHRLHYLKVKVRGTTTRTGGLRSFTARASSGATAPTGSLS